MTTLLEKPAELAGRIHATQLYGQGVLKRLGITIFHATVWTDAEVFSMEHPFALSVRYARRFSAYDLVERSLADMHRLERLDPAARAAASTALGTLFRDVGRDDLITAFYLPGQGASFFCNAALTGAAGDMLSRRFLDIWFSPRTTEPALREALLARVKGC
jgi:hypothetical protein